MVLGGERSRFPNMKGQQMNISLLSDAPKREHIRTEQVRETQRAYYQRNKEKIKARVRANYVPYPECSVEEKARRVDRSKRSYKKNPAKHIARKRHSNLLYRFGITREEYCRMLAAQGDACALCRSPDPRGGRKHFAVDHCHVTGRVRALLCLFCNNALGMFRDDPALCREAALYLENHGGSL